MSPFPLDFPGRLLRVYTHLGTHLRGHTATKVKLRRAHSSPPLCGSLPYIIQLPVRLTYSPKQTNGYQLDFMITRPFRYLSSLLFFFPPFSTSFCASPFPIPLSVRFRDSCMIQNGLKGSWEKMNRWLDSFSSFSFFVRLHFRGSWIDRGSRGVLIVEEFFLFFFLAISINFSSLVSNDNSSPRRNTIASHSNNSFLPLFSNLKCVLSYSLVISPYSE